MHHTDWEPYEPCPNCGESERFGETAKSHGTVYVEEGDAVDYQENHVGEALVVECLECDTVLMNKRIENAFDVLEEARDDKETLTDDERRTLNEAHYILQLWLERDA